MLNIETRRLTLNMKKEMSDQNQDMNQISMKLIAGIIVK